MATPLSWHYENPGLLVAEALGIEPAQLMATTTGGNNPQSLVNATALAIGRGELDVAVLVGADCVYTRAATRRHADRPLLPWTVQPPTTLRPTVFGNDWPGTTDAEEERGLDLPIHVYPLFENALRARAGRALDDHRARIGALWSRFSDMAVANPYAWMGQAKTAEEIAQVSEANRMVAYPYTKLLTANMQVDQGAALLVCSVAAARTAGIAEDRWVFPWAGADAEDHWFLSHRNDFHSSPAIRLAGSSALALAGATVDDVAHLDLLLLFPPAVEIAAEELGLPDDDPARPLTVTGGLTFAGGPGNNYGTHAVATMVGALRADPGSLGLVTGLGWYVTKHSVGIYGTEPRRGMLPTSCPGYPRARWSRRRPASPGPGPGRGGRPPPVRPRRRRRGRGHGRDLLGGLRAHRVPGAGRGGLPDPRRPAGLGQRGPPRPARPAGHRGGVRAPRHPPTRGPGRPVLAGTKRNRAGAAPLRWGRRPGPAGEGGGRGSGA